MSEKKEKVPPLESGLILAMKSIDNQIARAMQRTPAEREVHGVQKWEPLQERVERLCSLVLNWLGDEEIALDSVLVFARAFPKVLILLVDELGQEALGDVRTAYVREALEQIIADTERGLRGLDKGEMIN